MDDSLRLRVARPADLDLLRPVVDAAISQLQQGFLDPDQIQASRTLMGVDTGLVTDGTYFVVQTPTGEVAGCGGWSRRATLYGGDDTPGRSAALLDPATEPARVRAMYTHPAFVRRGVGRRILAASAAAARAEGFTTLELMSTLAGVPLYTAAGFVAVEHVVDERGGAPVPLVRMRRSTDPL